MISSCNQGLNIRMRFKEILVFLIVVTCCFILYMSTRTSWSRHCEQNACNRTSKERESVKIYVTPSAEGTKNWDKNVQTLVKEEQLILISGKGSKTSHVRAEKTNRDSRPDKGGLERNITQDKNLNPTRGPTSSTLNKKAKPIFKQFRPGEKIVVKVQGRSEGVGTSTKDIPNFQKGNLKTAGHTTAPLAKARPLTSSPRTKVRNNVGIQEKIQILMWTTIYLRQVNPINSEFEMCSYSNCELTVDKSAYNRSNAVVFHLWRDVSQTNFPSFRPKDQHWVLMAREPPTRLQEYVTEPLRWRFNLTMGYSRHSDIFYSYGKTRVIPNDHGNTRAIPNDHGKSRERAIGNFAKGRTKMIAWVVSHCWDTNERFEFAAELKRYIPLDVFGDCGKPCPGDTVKSSDKMTSGTCLQNIGKQYKFYLALENSDCEDYVTEKVWKNAYALNLIPIVRGTRVAYDTILPPGSYIHADKFKSIKNLADFMKTLDKRDDIYNSFFQWKFSFSTVYGGAFYCSLCEGLNKARGRTKVTDLKEWLNVEKLCRVKPSGKKYLKMQS